MNIFDKVATARTTGATSEASQLLNTLEKWLSERDAELGRLQEENLRLRIEHSKMLDQMQGMQHCMENAADVASKALRKAWQLGQTYWQQADSEHASHWKKAGETQVKFAELVDRTRAEILGGV